MAKLSREEIEHIVERDMPGYKVVEHQEGVDEREVQAAPDEVAPDIETLRQKYLGDADGAREESNPGNDADDTTENSADPNRDDANDDDDSTEDSIIAVQPKETADPFDHVGRPKAVVVSGKDRRIVGSQG
jgi:hypothetical protein